MKFFSFLTNCKGKINPRAALGLLGGVAAVGLTIGGYQHDVKNYPPERLSFAGLESDGGSYYGSAMDYSDNLGVVASSAERERGGRFTNVDNVDSNVKLGTAYQTGGGDNLVGNGRVSDTGKITYSQGDDMGDYPTRSSYAPYNGGATSPYSNGGGTAEGAQLASASMTHASGGSSGSSNSYAPGGSRPGANGNGGGNAGAGGTPATGEGYHLSGNMPGGSVEMVTGSPSRADFNNGSRHFDGGGSKTRQYAEGLAGIAKKSADIASNVQHENANAQARAFLDSGRVGVGGINFASLDDETGASSDLAPATIAKAQKAVKNWEQDKKAYYARLHRKRQDLAKRILILIGVTLGIAVGMNYLIQIGRKMPKPWGGIMIAAGWALMAGVTWYAVDLIKRAGRFVGEFKGDAGIIGHIGIGMSAVAVGFLTYIGIRAMTTKGTPGGDMSKLLKQLTWKRFLKEKAMEGVMGVARNIGNEVIASKNDDK